MKSSVFLLLACFCVCSVISVNEQSWGNVNARQIGYERVIEKSTILLVQTRKVNFPPVRFIIKLFFDCNSKTLLNHCFIRIFLQHPLVNPILGIKHIDYKSHPIKISIVSGGVNFKYVTLLLESQRGHGINSTLIFYGN